MPAYGQLRLRGRRKTGAAAALVSLGDVGPAQTMNGEQGSELCQVIFFRASVNEHTRLALAKDSLFASKLARSEPQIA